MHPRPMPGEILSSWMVRLAHANRYKVQEFYTLYFGRERQIWNRDIDHLAPEWLLKGLSAQTGIQIEELHSLSLRSFEGIVYENFREKTITRGLLPLGVYHRTRRNYGQQFCPLCLLEDEQAYLRKSWRIAFITTCEKHEVILHDRCEHCKQPMMPHRADMTSKTGVPANIGIEFCGSCGKKFTDSGTIKATPDAIAFQRMIFDCIKDGFVWVANKPLYSFIFLEGIRVIIHGKARIDGVREKYNFPKVEIEKCDVSLRHELLKDCWKLIDYWPLHFINFMSKHKRPYSTFISKNSEGFAPCWIDQAIKSNF